MENLFVPLTQVLVILSTVAMLWLTQVGIYQSLMNYGKPPAKSKKISWYVVLGLFLWLSILGLVASFGFFQKGDVLPPRVIWAVLPSVILIVVLLFSKSFSKFLQSVPSSWLVYVQSFRIVVEIILWLAFLGGLLPFQMTFEGFNYDIIAGLTAIIAGFVFFGKNRYRRFEAIIWNISGLALLMNIIVIAILSIPGPLRIFMNEPSNQIMAYFPYIWIPGFFVPYALAMHLFSLKQLILKQERGRNFTLRK